MSESCPSLPGRTGCLLWAHRLWGSHGLPRGHVWQVETPRESEESGLTRIATYSAIGFAFLLNKLLPTPTFLHFLHAYSPPWYPTQHWNSFHSNGLTLWVHCFCHVLHHPNVSRCIECIVKTHLQPTDYWNGIMTDPEGERSSITQRFCIWRQIL